MSSKEVEFLQRLAHHTVVLCPEKKSSTYNKLYKEDWEIVAQFIKILSKNIKLNWHTIEDTFKQGQGWSARRVVDAFQEAKARGYVAHKLPRRGQAGVPTYHYTGKGVTAATKRNAAALLHFMRKTTKKKGITREQLANHMVERGLSDLDIEEAYQQAIPYLEYDEGLFWHKENYKNG